MSDGPFQVCITWTDGAFERPINNVVSVEPSATGGYVITSDKGIRHIANATMIRMMSIIPESALSGLKRTT